MRCKFSAHALRAAAAYFVMKQFIEWMNEKWHKKHHSLSSSS